MSVSQLTKTCLILISVLINSTILKGTIFLFSFSIMNVLIKKYDYFIIRSLSKMECLQNFLFIWLIIFLFILEKENDYSLIIFIHILIIFIKIHQIVSNLKLFFMLRASNVIKIRKMIDFLHLNIFFAGAKIKLLT